MHTDILTSESSVLSGSWGKPAVIATTDFKFKSLSDFVFNTAVGCAHGCRFCYVVETSTLKQKAPLAKLGVQDPDAEWGEYVFVRDWEEEIFLKSLRAAENRRERDLKPEGNRAVMFSSTTDPYQTIKNADPKLAKELNKRHRKMVRRALELIRDESTLNVRILTRSPLAGEDFDLFKSFGPRLVFGMSLPTLNNKLCRVFEPNAPAPTQRLKLLKRAKEEGLHIYVAMAPTYPDCDEEDLHTTLESIADLDPITVFHEPINIRAENIERIRAHAEREGIAVNLDPFATNELWSKYAINQLLAIERIGSEVGLIDKIHLWPDQDLAKKSILQDMDDPTGFMVWIRSYWTKISQWPS